MPYPKVRMEIRLSQNLKDGLLREAAIYGLSLNAYTVYCLRNRKSGRNGPLVRRLLKNAGTESGSADS